MLVAKQILYFYKVVCETVGHDLVVVSSGVFDVIVFAGLTHERALACQTLEPGSSLGCCECGNTHLTQCKVLNQLYFCLSFGEFLSLHV